MTLLWLCPSAGEGSAEELLALILWLIFENHLSRCTHTEIERSGAVGDTYLFHVHAMQFESPPVRNCAARLTKMIGKAAVRLTLDG